ncbi:MAG: DUF5686 and carboxypeptidase regulatory-like domain-containing protein [Dysgonamonadaceae bacterium]|jgi:hypothetical protein|nr:DUF5686 and carboxypeptidase regulatory-like domain-containing protein [Dysgonamonadaceae bacterium]
MRKVFLFLIFIFSFPTAFAQNFTGVVINSKSEPLPGATVFIKSINKGLICNAEGEFQTTLAEGTYDAQFSYLSYKTKNQKVTIRKDETAELKIVLEDDHFSLKEATVTSGEDPAYAIMRKAIAAVDFHKKQVEKYSAECYIKCVFELLEVPKLIDKMTKMQVQEDGQQTTLKLSDLKNHLMLQETNNRIIFTAPDNYEQTVLAFSSSIPNDFKPEDAMELMRGSIYDALYMNCISPLNAKALSYYKFRYEGFTEDGNTTINKIKIIPKVANVQLFKGYIYIAENTWEVRNAELEATVIGITQQYTLTFSNVKNDVYLLSAYWMTYDINTFGVRGYFDNYASIKYDDISLNETVLTEKQKTKNKSKNRFELTADTTYHMRADSLAQKRDSLYWTEVRNTPLSDREIVSYEQKEVLQAKFDSIQNKDTDNKFSFGSLLFGGHIGGSKRKFEMRYGGLRGALGDYNFVDGWNLGQKLDFSFWWNKNKKLQLSPRIYYATARKTINYGMTASLDYAPLHAGYFYVLAASNSADFNPNGISKTMNTLSSLFAGQNFKMLYDRKIAHVGNHIDIVNGLRLTTEVTSAHRSELQNNTDFYFKIKDQSPVDYLLGREAQNRITPNFAMPGGDSYLNAFAVKFWYAPAAYYRIENGRKNYAYMRSPSFTLGYEQGLNLLQGKNNSVFSKITLAVAQNVRLSYFSAFSYKVGLGTFLGKTDKLNYIDFQHFASSPIVLSDETLTNRFLLLDLYKYSTDSRWLNAFVNYRSQYILLKRLPFLQRAFMTENLTFNLLSTPNQPFYNELGYSLSFMNMINAGAFVSFDKFRYQDFGLRLSVNLKAFD